jgi:alcohol dehydrogenase class IV
VVAANFNFPTNIRFGAGRVKDLPALSREAGMAAPLLVTDPALAEMAMTKEVVSDLAAAGLKVKVFCDVRSNPVAGNVEAGVKAYRGGGHDGVIAFGGGSALDVGKVVAFSAGPDAADVRFRGCRRLVDPGKCEGDRAGDRRADDGRHGLGGRPGRRDHATRQP